MSERFDYLVFEDAVMKFAAQYIKDNGVELTEENMRYAACSLADAGAKWERGCIGTTRVDFFKRLALVAQLAGEEG
jgi:hypothetical protein